MKTEISCGAVVFTKEEGAIKYIIIESKEGIFGFPKGHIEAGETETETAIREIKEETNLDVNIIDGFKAYDNYLFTRKDKTIDKKNVYFLAEFEKQTPIPQEAELKSITLMDFNTAMASFQFEGVIRILKEANDFLLSN